MFKFYAFTNEVPGDIVHKGNPNLEMAWLQDRYGIDCWRQLQPYAHAVLTQHRHWVKVYPGPDQLNNVDISRITTTTVLDPQLHPAQNMINYKDDLHWSSNDHPSSHSPEQIELHLATPGIVSSVRLYPRVYGGVVRAFPQEVTIEWQDASGEYQPANDHYDRVLRPGATPALRSYKFNPPKNIRWRKDGDKPFVELFLGWGTRTQRVMITSKALTKDETENYRFQLSGIQIGNRQCLSADESFSPAFHQPSNHGTIFFLGDEQYAYCTPDEYARAYYHFAHATMRHVPVRTSPCGFGWMDPTIKWSGTGPANIGFIEAFLAAYRKACSRQDPPRIAEWRFHFGVTGSHFVDAIQDALNWVKTLPEDVRAPMFIGSLGFVGMTEATAAIELEKIMNYIAGNEWIAGMAYFKMLNNEGDGNVELPLAGDYARGARRPPLNQIGTTFMDTVDRIYGKRDELTIGDISGQPGSRLVKFLIRDNNHVLFNSNALDREWEDTCVRAWDYGKGHRMVRATYELRKPPIFHMQAGILRWDAHFTDIDPLPK